MILPENISCALDMLESAGHEAWVVGGCVRDSLMGIIPHDYDITTSALPAETEQVFAGYRLIETGLKHGTVTVLADGSPIEITTYRVDGEYRDSRRPERVTFTRNIRDDVSRRDFTMNGIAYNPKQGYFDEFGGAEDIKAGVIRCIGKPEKRFREDALRILRGLRFSASLGFEIEENTARAMHDNRELLNKISAERVLSELCGLLTSRNSHRNIFRVLTEFRDIAAVIIRSGMHRLRAALEVPLLRCLRALRDVRAEGRGDLRRQRVQAPADPRNAAPRYREAAAIHARRGRRGSLLRSRRRQCGYRRGYPPPAEMQQRTAGAGLHHCKVSRRSSQRYG